MKICVFTICKNEAAFMPFFLRHYSSFADKIIVWDEASNDGTRDMIKACPKAELRNWMFRAGIDDYRFKYFAEEEYKSARGQFDWCFWVDVDEIIWDPDIRHTLSLIPPDVMVVPSCGYNMSGDGLPKDDGQQIWEIMQMGAPSSCYSKKEVFRPECDIKWSTGRHHIESPVKVGDIRLRLLHYRFLGREFTRLRNARNYSGNVDKGHAWSCAPTWTGAHSPDYAEEIKSQSVNVLTTPLYEPDP